MLDLYAKARQVASPLRAGGSPIEARSIKNAIDFGSTGSEIVMTPSIVLSDIATRPGLDHKLIERIVALRDGCTGAFGRQHEKSPVVCAST